MKMFRRASARRYSWTPQTKEGALLVGTGDLSELALGWCTYNADHMSMYGVNCSVPKTLVRYLVDFVADERGGKLGEVLCEILATPVSELLPPDKNGKNSAKDRGYTRL